MRKLLAYGLAFLLSLSPALAAPQGTVNLASPTGTVGMTSDTLGNLANVGAICGAAAATMWAQCVNQAIVNSSGQILTLTTLTGTVPLPTGASTSALQTTINTTLGAPMQNSGGTVTVTQATATNLNMTCGNCSGSGVSAADNAAFTGGTTQQALSGGVASASPTAASVTTGHQGAVGMSLAREQWIDTGTSSNLYAAVSGPIPAQTSHGVNIGGIEGLAAAGSAIAGDPVLTGGSDGTNARAFLTSTSGHLVIDCGSAGGSCSGSGGTSAADAAAWTAGTSLQTAGGCEFTTGGATALVTAHMGTVACTAGRAQFTDKTSVGGTALAAATSAYGTAPTGTTVEGVNAFVTNTNANGSATSPNSSPVVIASDQAAVAVKAASGAFASGSIASGALASGSIASGAAVSGAFVAGSIADLAHGQGAMAGSVPVTMANNQSAQASAGQGATGSAAPSGATLAGAVASGSLTGIIQGDTSAPIAISSATTTQVIALSSGKKTYIMGWDVVSAGAGTVQLEYGTGTNCGTVVGTLTGAYPLAANGGIVKPSGLGPALIVPASDEVCVVTTSSATAQGSITYTQF